VTSRAGAAAIGDGGRPLTAVLIGNLAGGALMMAAPLAELGVETAVYAAASEGVIATARSPGADRVQFLQYGRPRGAGLWGRIVTRLATELWCLAQVPRLMRADVIQSFTGSLFGVHAWTFVFGRLRLRRYIACATGSDIREVAAHDPGPAGRRLRAFFARAERVLLLNIDMPVVADRMGLTHATFFPFAVDTETFAPRPIARTVGRQDDLLIFMPSHLDWGVVDNAPGRSSTKGNDRLIRAFGRFLAEGGRGHLVMLDRGPDRAAARGLVADLGIGAHVTFRPHMSKDELTAHMNMADVVADQFDVGAFGTTALEGMACAKPVLMHIDMAHADRCYGERPPLLNARTEDEILEALRHASDPGRRQALGARARDWVMRFHDRGVVARRLLAIYRDIAAR
jgi:glycosyltransferase involved in cell wall biosynthesis